MGKVDRVVAGYTLGDLKPGPLPEVARLARTAAAEGAVLLKKGRRFLYLAEFSLIITKAVLDRAEWSMWSM